MHGLSTQPAIGPTTRPLTALWSFWIGSSGMHTLGMNRGLGSPGSNPAAGSGDAEHGELLSHPSPYTEAQSCQIQGGGREIWDPTQPSLGAGSGRADKAFLQALRAGRWARGWAVQVGVERQHHTASREQQGCGVSERLSEPANHQPTANNSPSRLHQRGREPQTITGPQRCARLQKLGTVGCLHA